MQSLDQHMPLIFVLWLACSVLAFIILKPWTNPWRKTRGRGVITVGDIVGGLIFCLVGGPLILFALLMEAKLSK